MIKNSLLAEHPWLAPALFEAFSKAKENWLETSSKEERLAISGGIVGGDPLPTSIEPNRAALSTIIHYAHNQKIIPLYDVEELFAQNTLFLK